MFFGSRHVAATYSTSDENAREGFNRFCSQHDIKVRDGEFSGVEGCQLRTIKFKRNREKVSVNVRMPFTADRFYLLIGFLMRSYYFSYDDVINEVFDLSTALPGFDCDACEKEVTWCREHNMHDITLALSGLSI